MTPRLSGTRGTTLVEVLVAMALVGVAVGTAALLSLPVVDGLDADPAAADAAQRGRGLLLALFDDLQRAGAGFLLATDRGPGLALPAVWPDGVAAGAWVAGARPGVLSAWHAPREASQGVVRTAVAAGASVVPLDRPVFCPPSSVTCGFADGDDVLVFDEHGRMAVAAVRQVLPPLDLVIDPPLAESWPAGAVAAAVRVHTYELRPDAATGLSQVVRRLASGPATPLADFVTAFDVTWRAQGAPPGVRSGPAGEDDPTAGPAPPPVAQAGAAGWPAGENCAFGRDAAGEARWRSATAGAGVESLSLAALSDGPWCPSPAAAVRWDADLVRVSELRIVLSVAVAADTLRLPASLGLRRPGARLVPELVLDTVIRPGRWNGGATP